MTEHFELNHESSDPSEIVIAHCRGNVKMDIHRVIKELNRLEDRRIELKAERIKLYEETALLWGVIDGIRSFIKLKNRDYDNGEI